ncbi:TNF receptor-associated factor 2-like [Haemaphysalis longicornis]
MSMSSIQAELIDISHSLKKGVAPTTSGDGETNKGSLETRQLRESLSEIRTEMAIQRQLDEFMKDATAKQQILYDSFVKKNEVVKQILTKAGRLEMGQRELAPQFPRPAFREAMGDRHRETKAQLHQFSLKIDSQCDRSCELLRLTPAHLLSSIPFATKHTWMFEEFESLRQTADKECSAEAMVGPVYLRGYFVSAGIRLYDSGRLYFLFQLYKGKNDGSLEWPFNLKMVFSMLHPRGSETVEYSTTPSSFPGFQNHFSRPVRRFNSRIGGSIVALTAEELESRGFIEDGRVLLSLALEPIGDDEEP